MIATGERGSRYSAEPTAESGLRLVALGELELGQAQPRLRVGRLRRTACWSVARAASVLLRGELDRRGVEQRVDRQRVDVAAALRVSARARGKSRGLRAVEGVGAGVDRALGLPRRPGGHDADGDGGDGQGRRARARARPRAAGRGRAMRLVGRARGRRASRRTAAPRIALPGTNQVQSTKECTPKTTQMASSVAMPTRSGVHGARRARADQARPCAPAAASHAASSASEASQPDQPEVGQRLHDVAVGVAHVERVVADSAGARSRSRRRRRRRSLVRLGDLQRLVPVARAHAADRGEAVGRVGRGRLACGSVRSFQPVGDASRRGRAGWTAPARRRGRRARAPGTRSTTMPAWRRASSDGARCARWRSRSPARRPAARATIATSSDAELVAGGGAVGEQDVVLAQRVLRERPQRDRAAAAGADMASTATAAQAQRHERRTRATQPTARASSAPRE